jgi:glutamate synthase (NADPH/NADH) small chain
MQCEAHCILAKTNEPVCIGGIERFIGDNTSMPKAQEANGKKIAIIGSGPSGLTVAAMLSLGGAHVKIFESTHAFGGVIKYGVPDFRLPKEVIKRELKGLQELGIEFEPNAKIDNESLEEFAKKFDAVFVGTGVGTPKKLSIPGAELKGVYSAMTFLVNLNQSDIIMVKPGEKVVVVGAGYVGIDAARAAIRLGGEVTCITSSKKEDAIKTVAPKDYEEAEEEGVKFKFGLKVDSLEGTEGSEGIEKVHYTNSKKGLIEATKVIVAIGQEHDEDTIKKPLRTGEDGCVKVNKSHQTVIKNVFAAGDCVHGPKTVIHAIAAGREAAKSMLKYLGEKS